MRELQALMRRWRRLAPYNTIHALRVPGETDLGGWQRAVDEVLPRCGLPPPPAVTRVAALNPALAEALATDLGDAEPVRVLVADEAGPSHWLVLVVGHWQADSPAVRALARRLLAEARGLGPLPPLAHFSPPRAGLLGGLRHAAGQWRRHRRAVRLPLGDPLDFRCGVTRVETVLADAGPLQRRARQAGATVGDLLLACAARALAPVTAAQVRHRPDRPALGLGLAVDVRPHAGLDPDAFGLALGCAALVVDDPGATVAELLAQIAPATRAARTPGVLQLDGGLRCARLALALQRTRADEATLLHRALPLAAVLSNVRLDGTWVADTPDVLDYVRVSPAGPLAPLVLATTTLRGRLSLSATWRRTAFSDEAASAVIEAFVGAVRAEAAPEPGPRPAC